jgi:ABC-type dipeptide/oligopeptide/nickel transport system permease component
VLTRHILRNADRSYPGMIWRCCFDVVVIEAVFGWPGISFQAWNAIRNQDAPVIWERFYSHRSRSSA